MGVVHVHTFERSGPKCNPPRHVWVMASAALDSDARIRSVEVRSAESRFVVRLRWNSEPSTLARREVAAAIRDAAPLGAYVDIEDF